LGLIGLGLDDSGEASARGTEVPLTLGLRGGDLAGEDRYRGLKSSWEFEADGCPLIESSHDLDGVALKGDVGVDGKEMILCLLSGGG